MVPSARCVSISAWVLVPILESPVWSVIIWLTISPEVVVKVVDEAFFNELKKLKEECVVISREDLSRVKIEEQQSKLDKLSELVEKLQEAFGKINIDIKVRQRWTK